MKLSANRQFLIARMERVKSLSTFDEIPTITGALKWISERERALVERSVLTVLKLTKRGRLY
jgi:hypothetical protein